MPISAVWYFYEPKGRGFESLLAYHVGTSYACSDFFCAKNQSPASLFLLFRKRSRSSRLFTCKRVHNAFVSLPTFCESVPATQVASVLFCFARKSDLFRQVAFSMKFAFGKWNSFAMKYTSCMKYCCAIWKGKFHFTESESFLFHNLRSKLFHIEQSEIFH